MPAQLLLAPAGAGKTETALQRLSDLKAREPFARVWVLLSGDRQIINFQRRMMSYAAGQQVVINVEMFQFYDLYARLLDSAGIPVRRLDDAARYCLLRHLLADLQSAGALTIFTSIAQTPGFIRIVASFIYELKQNGVTPDDFERAALTEKDHELAQIYAAYQRTLQDNNLVDRDGEGWLALEAVQQNAKTIQHVNSVDLLLVDGYDQFTVLQARLLAELAKQTREALVTLTTVPGREETIGRRFERARRALQDAGGAFDSLASSDPIDDRHPALLHLLDHIFQPRAATTPSGGAVRFVEAPDAAQEVGAVLRRVKQLLLEGCAPDDIVIALRDWGQYAAHIAALGRAYGDLPLALHYGEPLGENPAIVTLLNLLDLHTADFRWRDLLDALRSPYFSVPNLTAEHTALLEKIARRQFVTGGRESWLNAIAVAARPAESDEDDERMFAVEGEHTGSPLPVEPDVGDDLRVVPDFNQLHAALTDFFDAVTPPERATVGEYVTWLETLIGRDPHQPPDENPDPIDDGYSLDMIASVRAATDDRIVGRDLAALHALKQILRALLAAQELTASLSVGMRNDVFVPITWADFIADLKLAIGREATQRAGGRDGRVLVTGVTDARGLPHQHVFVLGLAEGMFPARVPEDPLYLDSERIALRERGVSLPTQAERADDDGLFYELISLARESLTLSRPYLNKGELLPESHLWRVTWQLFSDANQHLNRIRIGAVPPAGEVASAGEAALAVASGLNQPDLAVESARLYNWLLDAGGDLWTRVRLGRAVERGRMSRRPHDRYSGRLSQADLVAHVARLLSPGRVWSASQLNDYGICPFRFFAVRLLQLEPLEPPDEGMTVLQVGTLNHDILEATYRQIAAEGLPITPENAERAVAILHEAARDKLRDAPMRLGFQASALWEQEQRVLLRRLGALVRHDFADKNDLTKFIGDGVRTVDRLEAPFGMDGDVLALALGGETLRVRGKIDRIDRVGERVFVVDYKTGSTQIDAGELARGRNFQMMLYLLAARALFGETVEGGVFWHIGSGDIIGKLRFDDEGSQAIAAAGDHIARYLAAGRRGDFAVHANKVEEGRCARYCDYHRLCRMAVTNRRKRDD